MSTHFTANYGHPPPPGFGLPPTSGQDMYNGYGQQGHAVPGMVPTGGLTPMKSGIQPPPPMTTSVQNGPMPGPQGDIRYNAPHAPGPPSSFSGHMPGMGNPPVMMPGPQQPVHAAEPLMRGPPPVRHATAEPPPVSQFAAMNVTDQHMHNRGPGAPPRETAMTQPNYGAGQVPGGMGPPITGSVTPESGFGPQQSGMGPPPSGFRPPSTNVGPPPVSGYMAPPQGVPPPTSGLVAAPTNVTPSQTRFGAPPTSQPPLPVSSMGSGPQQHSMPLSSAAPPMVGISQGQFSQAAPQQSPGFGPPPPTGQMPPAGQMPPTGQVTPTGQMPPTSGFNPPASTGFPPTNQYAGGPQSSPYPAGMPQQYNYSNISSQRPGPATQPQQPRKLNPDQMPSPIQVIEDDRKSHSGLFPTGSRGTLPPLVTTEFIAQDQGICNPRFIRSTMYNVPCTSDMLKGSHIPFVLTVTPFAKLHDQEQPPPLVDLGDMGPVRCTRCKAYMNPFMQFIDGGRRFLCAFCGCATDVPPEYFAHLDHTGKRIDAYTRAELCLGSYEFTATTDYCKNGVPPKEPAFIFMIDVSYNSVKSGLVNLICEKLKSDILVNLPKESGMEESAIRVGFVTYAKELHFYNVKGALAQPQMMVVSDVSDMFVPLLDGFLVTLAESEAVIDSLLAQIPELFADSRETETVLAPVIQAGLDAMKSADRSGKLFIFHTSLPTAEAPGKLKNRDDRKLLGTEKEKTLLTTQSALYTKLGQECVAAGCCVDLFLFPNSYCDVASMSEICRLTSGNIYKYSYFQADLDGERFIEDLKRNICKPVAFDAILRVRTSTGIRPVDFYGNFYMANTTDVELAAIDCDQSICAEIKHDDKLPESEGAYIQVALLYTSVSGKRRLRVHNLALNCCTQMADLFRSCELDVLINFMSKQAIRQTLNTNPKQVREHIMNEVSQILACYRKTCANPSSAGQLILPECMKLLPLYANCIIKNDGIQGGSEISTDDRSYLMHLINSMDVQSSNVFFYPKLLPLFDLDLDSNEEPTAIRCSVERLQDTGIYLLENGLSMFLWVGLNVAPDMIQKVFGVASAAQIDIDKGHLLDLDNPVSRRICGIVKKIRDKRSRYLKLSIVRQRDKLEPWFNHFLVEDKGLNGSASYVDFLCHIHKEIRNILS